MLKRNDVAAAGNAQVIEILEAYLIEARKGKLDYLALVACVMPDDWGIAIGGDAAMEQIAKKGLAEIAEKIDARELNHRMPPRDPALGDDYVCYNLAACPVSFDFLFWLVEAEMGRRRVCRDAPLKVSFWPGRDGIGRLNEPVIKRMFENVLRPLVTLIGGVEVAPTFIGRCRNVYTSRNIVTYSREGEDVPRFCAPPAAKATVAQWMEGRRPPVTITLREAKHWSHRNSNMKAWIKFARYLQNQGEWVVFVRDTQRADERIDGFKTYPLAATDLLVRTALYEAAKANLFVSNGPAQIALFLDRPTLQFIKLEQDGHSYYPNTPNFWRENMGIGPGEQFPWLRKDQRIIWASDTYENILDAWNEMVRCSPEPAAAMSAPVEPECRESRKDTFASGSTGPGSPARPF